MIQKRFKYKIEELKGLINEDSWSAPSTLSGGAGPDGPTFLVAVSGGMDSMCLAELFVSTCGCVDVAVAHCNFNLRGEESDGDEALVREWAGQWNLRLHVNSFDTVSYAARHNMSIEMAARELRYSWFARLCLEHGYRYVAVAHHADDNAETLMLNMVRGTGLKGLTGMSPVSDLPCTEGHVPAKLIRPMLEFSRKQIEGFVLTSRIPYRNDSSNSSVEYRRNRIRHEVFPVLEKLNPSFVATLNREMAYLSDASDIVDDWCRTAAETVVTGSDGCGGLRISVSRLLSYRQWRYLLYHILEPYGFNSSVLSSLENLLESDRTMSGKRFVSETHEVRTERDVLVVSPLSEGFHAEEELVVEEAGLYRFNDVTFAVEVCPWTADMSPVQPDGVQIFDASKLSFPLTFRTWKQGDWMVPLGMRGKRKISDIFSDMKYDGAAKRSAIVLAGTHDDRRAAALLWVRMDTEYKVDSRTRYVIRISRR